MTIEERIAQLSASDKPEDKSELQRLQARLQKAKSFQPQTDDYTDEFYHFTFKKNQNVIDPDRNLPADVLVSGNVGELKAYLNEAKNGKKLTEQDKRHLKDIITANEYIRLLEENKATNNAEPPKLIQTEQGVFLAGVEMERNQSSIEGCWSISLEMQLRSRGVYLPQEMIRAFRSYEGRRQDMPADYREDSSVRGYNSDREAVIDKGAAIITRVLPNTGMRLLNFGVAENTAARRDDIFARIRASIMEKRAPVSMCIGGHYYTVIGVDPVTQTLHFQDSLAAPEDTGKVFSCTMQEAVDFAMHRVTKNPNTITIAELVEIRPGSKEGYGRFYGENGKLTTAYTQDEYEKSALGDGIQSDDTVSYVARYTKDGVGFYEEHLYLPDQLTAETGPYMKITPPKIRHKQGNAHPEGAAALGYYGNAKKMKLPKAAPVQSPKFGASGKSVPQKTVPPRPVSSMSSASHRPVPLKKVPPIPPRPAEPIRQEMIRQDELPVQELPKQPEPRPEVPTLHVTQPLKTEQPTVQETPERLPVQEAAKQPTVQEIPERPPLRETPEETTVQTTVQEKTERPIGEDYRQAAEGIWNAERQAFLHFADAMELLQEEIPAASKEFTELRTAVAEYQKALGQLRGDETVQELSRLQEKLAAVGEAAGAYLDRKPERGGRTRKQKMTYRDFDERTRRRLAIAKKLSDCADSLRSCHDVLLTHREAGTIPPQDRRQLNGELEGVRRDGAMQELANRVAFSQKAMLRSSQEFKDLQTSITKYQFLGGEEELLALRTAAQAYIDSKTPAPEQRGRNISERVDISQKVIDYADAVLQVTAPQTQEEEPDNVSVISVLDREVRTEDEEELDNVSVISVLDKELWADEEKREPEPPQDYEAYSRGVRSLFSLLNGMKESQRTIPGKGSREFRLLQAAAGGLCGILSGIVQRQGMDEKKMESAVYTLDVLAHSYLKMEEEKIDAGEKPAKETLNRMKIAEDIRSFTQTYKPVLTRAPEEGWMSRYAEELMQPMKLPESTKEEPRKETARENTTPVL